MPTEDTCRRKKAGKDPRFERWDRPFHWEAADPFLALLERLEVCSAAAAVAAGFDVEADLLAFNETAHAGAIKRADVNENVLAAIFRSDEAKTLLAIVEFYGTCSHDRNSQVEMPCRNMRTRSSIEILEIF